ncbi:MAG: hypothetical protein JF630_00145 [Geodermatophilales bacterium]|nr:hypothetical protein [Geodermatophilales bacterium]
MPRRVDGDNCSLGLAQRFLGNVEAADGVHGRLRETAAAYLSQRWAGRRPARFVAAPTPAPSLNAP